MKPAATRHQSAQCVRWERMHVAIRCGLHLTQPALIRVYLGVGRWLVREARLDERAANQGMLHLLLDTALDDALPWFWRSLCLEYTPLPLARLTTLLKFREPAALQSLNNRLQSAHLQLAAASPSPTLLQAETRRS